MPGKSKEGGGLESSPVYKKSPLYRGIGKYEGEGEFKMKNSMLRNSVMYGSPMQGNYGSSMKHMGEAKHPTGDIKSHDGHMSKKMTKNIKDKMVSPPFLPK